MKRMTLALCVLAVVLCFSCGGDDGDPPGPTTNLVTIRDNFYEPANIVVSIGRPVFWRNEGTVIHTITSGTPTSNPGSVFDSGNIAPGGGFQVIFSTPGNFPYFCKLHGVSMTGTVSAR